MTFELYTDAVLTRDVPEHGLCRSEVVKLIDHHPVPGGEDGYSIEVFNILGDTIAVTSVPESAYRSVHVGAVVPVHHGAIASMKPSYFVVHCAPLCPIVLTSLPRLKSDSMSLRGIPLRALAGSFYFRQ